MLLRAAIVMLVMLNLGAAAWWVWSPAATPVVSGNDPAVPSLLLLSERSAVPAQRSAMAAPVSVRGPTEADAAVSATPALSQCLRLGPIPDAATQAAVQTAVQNMGASVRVIAPSHPSARGWKVFLPPQPSREAAQALVAQLQAAGIRDVLMLTDGPDANAIALGRFRREEGARKRLQELAVQGVQAQMVPEGDAVAGWLEVRLPAEISVQRVAQMVKVPAQPCATDQAREE